MSTENLEIIANEVVSEHESSGISLSDSVRKAMHKYALNQNYTERLIERTNHVKFNRVFSQDKTAVFDAAKKDEVFMTSAETPTEYEIYHFGKIASAIENDYSLEEDPETEEQLIKIAEEALDGMAMSDSLKSKDYESLKNQIVMLVQQGENKDDIYKFLTQSLGINNDEASKDSFDMLVEGSQAQGYMKDSPSLNMKKTASGKGPEGQNKSRYKDLVKTACSIRKKMASQMENELVFDHCFSKVANSSEYDYKIKEMFDRSINLRVSNELLYAPVMKSIKMEKTAANAVTSQLDVDKIKKVIGTMLIGGGLAASSVGMINAADNGIESIQRAMLRNRLKDRYSYLNDIPEQTYNDIYDGITKLQPELMKAPFPLAEMIRHQANYGTIDPQMTMNLLNSGLNVKRKPSDILKTVSFIDNDNVLFS